MPMPWERGTNHRHLEALADGESASQVPKVRENDPPPRGVDSLIVIDDRDNPK